MNNPFLLPGMFLKGNLHTHTTNSDGHMSPQEAIDFYRNNGYDFLAITDHNILTRTDLLDSKGLTMLPGMELHQGVGELGQVHHIVAIGMETNLQVPETTSLQTVLNFIVPRCRFAFIAHPYWTSLTPRDIMGMSGHVGIEVFNTTCEVGIGRGHSEVYWDLMLAFGERTLGFAVDDCHSAGGADALGGWIMARVPDPSILSITSAIVAGNFYSTTGPEIKDIRFASGTVTVRCSPCQQINVISPLPGCGATTRTLPHNGELFTDVTLPVAESWNIVRIECIDAQGRKAWTNPFFMR